MNLLRCSLWFSIENILDIDVHPSSRRECRKFVGSRNTTDNLTSYTETTCRFAKASARSPNSAPRSTASSRPSSKSACVPKCPKRATASTVPHRR